MTSDEMKRVIAARLAFEEEFAKQASASEWPRVEASLNRAMAQVIARDFELLEDGRSERAVAHRLAVYLEGEFPAWHVDCEFNRQGDGRASDGQRDRKQVSSEPPLLEESKEGSGVAEVDPDIIVHRRRKRLNLLAIEVKAVTSAGIKRDRVKLRKYLSEPELNYTFAALVLYRIGANFGFLPVERIPHLTAGDSSAPVSD